MNVFASWCGPCRDEHPQIMALSELPDVTVVGINQKDKPEDAIRFLRNLGNPYDRVGADVNGRVSIDWGVLWRAGDVHSARRWHDCLQEGRSDHSGGVGDADQAGDRKGAGVRGEVEPQLAPRPLAGEAGGEGAVT